MTIPQNTFRLKMPSDVLQLAHAIDDLLRFSDLSEFAVDFEPETMPSSFATVAAAPITQPQSGKRINKHPMHKPIF